MHRIGASQRPRRGTCARMSILRVLLAVWFPVPLKTVSVSLTDAGWLPACFACLSRTVKCIAQLFQQVIPGKSGVVRVVAVNLRRAIHGCCESMRHRTARDNHKVFAPFTTDQNNRTTARLSHDDWEQPQSRCSFMQLW